MFILKIIDLVCRKLWYRWYHFTCSVANRIIISRCEISVGENLSIRGKLFVRGNNISIGRNVIINSDKYSNPIGGDNRTIFDTYFTGKIIIGNNVGMSNCTLCAFDAITIEDDVMLGGGVRLYTTDFHSVRYIDRMKTPDTTIKHAPITIKKGAFIGADVIVLKGVVIGERAVVGAGSVVTTNIPADEIWAGNPARFIKKIVQ